MPDKTIKEVKKAAQKIMIQTAVSTTTNLASSMLVNQANNKSNNICSKTKISIQNISKNMGNSLKG